MFMVMYRIAVNRMLMLMYKQSGYMMGMVIYRIAVIVWGW